MEMPRLAPQLALVLAILFSAGAALVTSEGCTTPSTCSAVHSETLMFLVLVIIANCVAVVLFALRLGVGRSVWVGPSTAPGQVCPSCGSPRPTVGSFCPICGVAYGPGTSASAPTVR